MGAVEARATSKRAAQPQFESLSLPSPLKRCGHRLWPDSIRSFPEWTMVSFELLAAR
ncbi:hypothetical protein CC79DRAFT_1330579 [Sarocladium strictum]